MSEPTITSIKRSKIRSFLNTGTSSSPTFNLIGDGVAEMTIAYNPDTEENAYIHEDAATTELNGYKPSFANEMVAKAGEPIFDYLDNLRINRAVGDEAKSEIVNVYMYKTATSNAYPAEKCACTVQIDEFGGEGAKLAKLKYTVTLNGDPVQGTFDPTTKTFTPSGE